MGWFGRKGGLKEPAAPQLSLGEAIDAAVRAQSMTTWAVGAYEVVGEEGRCSVGARGSSYAATELALALNMAYMLKERFGDDYSYRFTVYGTVTRQTLSSVLAPGWRPYAQPIDDVFRTVDSIEEFEAWMESDDARWMRLDAWWVSVRKD